MAASCKDLESFRKLYKAQNLSQCAEEYLDCLADPISAPTGCLPTSMVNIPSRKLKVTAQGSFQTGATGGAVGFILVRPGSMITNDDNNTAGDGAIRYTTSAFTGATLSATTVTTGVLAANSNSDYTKAQIGVATSASPNLVQYRLVSCAIEIENTTPWQTRGGQVVGVCEQNHQNLDGYNYTQLANLDCAFREGISSSGVSRYQLKYNGPADPSDLDYSSGIGGGSIPICQAFMAIMVSADVDSIQTFAFRVAAHFEVIGGAARTKTVTWPDPHGASLVQSIMAKAHNEASQANHDSPVWWQTLGRSLLEGAKAVASGVDKLHVLKKVAVGALESAVPGSGALIDVGQAAYAAYAAAAPMRSIAPRAAPRAKPKTAKKAAKPSKSVFKPRRKY